MDASNPIQDSTRMTIGNMKERSFKIKRQNLDYLNGLCGALERIKLEKSPSLGDPEVRSKRVAEVCKETAEKHKAIIDANNKPEFLNSDTLGKFLNIHDPIPVCNILRDGIPIHPASVNQAKGYANNHSTFGSIGIDKELASLWSEYLETDGLVELIRSMPIYTLGTTKGLQVRLEQQLSRKTVPLTMPYKRFLAIMEKRMPVNLETLNDWNSDIYELAELVKSSYNSSAGPPYWRKKQECIEDLMEVTLPLVCKALCTEGGLETLFKENPEMFLTVVKNKDDRYKDCTVKTRPYVAMPWHFQILFSILSQSFCNSLFTFVEKPHSYNAYGFSYAHGGGNQLAAKVLNLREGKIFAAFYGDDAYVAVKIKGVTYLICPDFQQMDGSIDEKTVNYTLRWIRDCYAKKFGENQFWNNVIKLWEEFVLDPYFLVQGTTVYKKKQRGGIMSGVVGTTLFDTVKSVCAYQELFDLYEQAPSQLLDAKLMTKFFKDRGLVIKEGTWKPTEVHEPPVGGTLTDLQFLGMQLRRMEYNNGDVYVPVNPTLQWLTLALTPKRAENVKGVYQRSRYLFDRLRGSLTSGGVFDEEFYKLCNATLTNLPPAAIAMEVMAGNGKGSVPELVHTVGSDFQYSTSMGWPTLEWALDLYADVDQKIPGREVMDEYFLDPNGVLKQPKRPKIMPQAVIVDARSGLGLVSSSVITVDEPDRVPVVEDLTPLMPVAPKVEMPKDPHFNKRSKILNYLPLQGKIDSDLKYVPGIAEQIKMVMGPLVLDRPVKATTVYDDLIEHCKRKNKDELLNIVKSNKFDLVEETLLGLILDGQDTEVDKWSFCFSRMCPLSFIAHRVGVSEALASFHIRQLGYFVFGSPSNQYACPVPIAPVHEKYREQIKKQEIENIQEFKEIKQTLKDSPISEKTQKLIDRSKDLKVAVDRAEERPAMLPPPLEKEEGENVDPLPFKFKFIPGLDARAALYQNKRAKYQAATTIYREGGLRYIEESSETAFRFFIFDPADPTKRYLFHRTEQSRRDAYMSFYTKTINRYLLDVEVEREFKLAKYKTSDWSKLAEVEEQVKVTLFKEHGRPVLAQMANRPIVLLEQNHEKLKPTENGTGFYIQEGNNKIRVSFTRGLTGLQKTQRLNQILGTEVEMEQISYNTFINSYKQFDDLVGVTKRFESISRKRLNNERKTKQNEEAKQQQEGRGKSRGKSGSAETTKRRRSKTKEKARSKEKRQQNLHEQSSHPEGGGERVRLPRFYNPGPYRQSWGDQGYHQYVPYGMGWYPGPSRGQVMAALPPQEPGYRNIHFRQQNDGRPVYSGMGGRPRRNYSNRGRRGPKQIYEPKPLPGGSHQ